jgi:hypothetical protein
LIGPLGAPLWRYWYIVYLRISWSAIHSRREIKLRYVCLGIEPKTWFWYNSAMKSFQCWKAAKMRAPEDQWCSLFLSPGLGGNFKFSYIHGNPTFCFETHLKTPYWNAESVGIFEWCVVLERALATIVRTLIYRTLRAQ